MRVLIFYCVAENSTDHKDKKTSRLLKLNLLFHHICFSVGPLIKENLVLALKNVSKSKGRGIY